MEFRDEAALIEHLRVVDAPCLGCGYSMRGLGGLKCPECGRRFEAGDLGKTVRPAWRRFLMGGWGWWMCVAVVLSTFVWESAVEDEVPGWYRAWFQGRNGSGLVAMTALALIFLWPLVRFRAKARAMAEPVLALAWGVAAVQVIGLLIVSVM